MRVPRHDDGTDIILERPQVRGTPAVAVRNPRDGRPRIERGAPRYEGEIPVCRIRKQRVSGGRAGRIKAGSALVGRPLGLGVAGRTKLEIHLRVRRTHDIVKVVVHGRDVRDIIHPDVRPHRRGRGKCPYNMSLHRLQKASD